MKKKDWIIVGAALGLALVMLVLFRVGALTGVKKAQDIPDPEGITVTLIDHQGGTTETTLHTFQAGMTRVPASSYVVATVGRRVYEPIPMDAEKLYTLVIDQPNGTQNKAVINAGEVFMQSATCENQKCVHQGVVSLANRDLRALYNQIICTPNQVVLDVYSEDEAKAMYEENK